MRAVVFAAILAASTPALAETRSVLTSIPDEIGALQALSTLNLSDNALEELPAGAYARCASLCCARALT